MANLVTLLLVTSIGYVSQARSKSHEHVLTLAKVFAKIIYNLFFHPLAGHPGPFLARISPWPNFYHAVKGDRHIWLWQNFQIYGE